MLFRLDLQFFAHKKGGGSASTNCNHDSRSKSRGVKKFGGERVKAGYILVRQLGSKFLPGENTYLSNDYTIHAKKDGVVSFYQKKIRQQKKTFIKVN